MIFSRIILAMLMLTVGSMVFGVDQKVEKLSGELVKMETHMTAIESKIDTIQFLTDMKLQRAIGWVGKPRVPPVRHVYRKAPTVIDIICLRP